MSYKVLLTTDAARDLEELDEYLCASDSEEKADYVLGKIEALLQQLSESPERGTRPRELLTLGVGNHRQVYFKPYRVIYTVEDTVVYIVLIADGRRDMETLLQRRLLGG